jgi:hypothetical protein
MLCVDLPNRLSAQRNRRIRSPTNFQDGVGFRRELLRHLVLLIATNKNVKNDPRTEFDGDRSRSSRGRCAVGAREVAHGTDVSLSKSFAPASRIERTRAVNKYNDNSIVQKNQRLMGG